MQFTPTRSRLRFSSIKASARKLALPIACLAVLALAPPALAGSYSGPQYSGGQFTCTDDNPLFDRSSDYVLSNFMYGYANTDLYGPGSSSCSGPITTTFTYTADTGQTVTTDPPPQSVIVEENCTASFNASSQGTADPPPISGSCDNGLNASGNPMSSSGPDPLAPGYYNASMSDSRSSIRYEVKPGAAPFTLTCSPSAQASYTENANVDVAYSATALPVTIDLTGTTLDSSGNADVLTGQQVTATLNGIPSNFTVNDYTWSVGGDAFKTYDETAPNSV